MATKKKKTTPKKKRKPATPKQKQALKVGQNLMAEAKKLVVKSGKKTRTVSTYNMTMSEALKKVAKKRKPTQKKLNF